VPAATALHVALLKLGEASEAMDIDALSKASLFQPRGVAFGFRTGASPARHRPVARRPDYDDLGRHMPPATLWNSGSR
jgi:hypothetical protein